MQEMSHFYSFYEIIFEIYPYCAYGINEILLPMQSLVKRSNSSTTACNSKSLALKDNVVIFPHSHVT